VFRLFLNDGYALAAASPKVTVASVPATNTLPYGGGSNRSATQGGSTVSIDAAGNTPADPRPRAWHSPTTRYLRADQLNTPRLATNTSGTVVWR
jgi:hypothetical protein